MEIITNSQEETYEFGKELAGQFRGGDILLLNGELGTGKTTLMKGLADGLGVKVEVSSPTFTLMNHYPTKNHSVKNLVHIDTYRLKDEHELKDIGIEDYLCEPESLCVIEWPEKLSGLLKNKKTFTITIEHLGENKRKIMMI
ncbi:MAG: tRNA (adenosine(37)-N6)-threonylcarbamoyltransferase complex ATPase subunit type 1 TsaE [Candidatus Magasanikbacteria bacterium]|jgi:tRNA threonylcarbamoyladenosine biosynthesis protein TsaE